MYREPYEGLENEPPYMFMRAGKIKTVNYDRTELEAKTPSEAHKLGTVEIEWLDCNKENSTIPLTYQCFSNPVIKEEKLPTPSTGSSYGFTYMPSAGDIVVCGFRDWTSPVIVGFLPLNFEKQTSTNATKDKGWGTFRLLVPGEFSWKSKQQAEIYLDRSGAIQTSVKVQPDTDKEVPSVVLAEGTIGIAYGSTRMSDAGNQIVFEQRVNTTPTATNPTWAHVQIDSKGTIYLLSANNQSITMDSTGISIVSHGASLSLTAGSSASNSTITATVQSTNFSITNTGVSINSGALSVDT